MRIRSGPATVTGCVSFNMSLTGHPVGKAKGKVPEVRKPAIDLSINIGTLRGRGGCFFISRLFPLSVASKVCKGDESHGHKNRGVWHNSSPSLASIISILFIYVRSGQF